MALVGKRKMVETKGEKTKGVQKYNFFITIFCLCEQEQESILRVDERKEKRNERDKLLMAE